MIQLSLRLSVEELALVFNQIGRADKADELISARYGSMSKEESAIRLVTAGNSLMAMDLLTQEDGANILDETLAYIGESITDAEYTIWCSYNAKDKVSYHFCEDTIMENKIEFNVVHEITELNDKKDVLQSILGIYDIFHAEAFDCKPVIIPNTSLGDFLEEKDAISIVQRLKTAELDVEIPAMFAEDWDNAQFWGMMMRLEHKKSNSLFDRGFIVLRGPKRFWIMHPTNLNGEAVMELLPATTEVFVKEFEALM